MFGPERIATLFGPNTPGRLARATCVPPFPLRGHSPKPRGKAGQPAHSPALMRPPPICAATPVVAGPDVGRPRATRSAR